MHIHDDLRRRSLAFNDIIIRVFRSNYAGSSGCFHEYSSYVLLSQHGVAIGVYNSSRLKYWMPGCLKCSKVFQYFQDLHASFNCYCHFDLELVERSDSFMLHKNTLCKIVDTRYILAYTAKQFP